MFEPEDTIGGNTTGGGEGYTPSMEITPQYAGTEATLPPYSSGRLTTRSLITNETTVAMRANFLRIDEDVAPDDSGLYTYSANDNPSSSPYYKTINWAESYLLEATLLSSPDKDHIRSAYLNPVQTYKMRVYTDENDVTDTLDFYHTRMVSWYPMSCGDGEGSAPICKFGEVYAEHMEEGVDSNGNGYVALKVTGLDGQTDLMVSDVCEGQYWHSPDTPADSKHYLSDYAPAGHPTLAEGTKTYAAPFGSHKQDRILDSNGETIQWAVNYDNHINYKHYLSAVRVFAHADQSPQNLSMWGDLEHVTIADQPTSVKIMLPTKLGEWGEAFDWGDTRELDIITGKIFGEGDSNSDLHEEAKYPISFKGITGEAYAYLGYALVCPDHDVEIMLHTTSGVYSVTIPHHFIDHNGNVADIFHESNIYDIRLNLRTNGTIAAILEKEEDKIYYDLTRLTVYKAADEDEEGFAIHHYANTHIVSPDHTPAFDKDGNMIYEADGVTPKYIEYDGYCFDATTIGNGQVGIISLGTQTLYPTNAHIEPSSARLLWEDQLGLVTNVEFLYGYVRFRVPNHSSRGNAVIAVYDKEGKVLWSWHIWITDPPQTKTYQDGSFELDLLDRNLGATSATWSGAGDALDTYGLYYQWGRKDPSMGPQSYNYSVEDLITKPYYDYSSRERTAAEITQFARPTVRDGVENPMFLIMPTAQQQAYYFNWIYERNDILWGYHESDGTMLKTIYDPCPFGYRVPLHSELSKLFESRRYTGLRDDYGQWVVATDNSNIYFPYAGFKGVDRDLQSLVLSWNYVGQKGDYMTSTISKDNSGSISGHPILDHRGRVYLTNAENWNETEGGDYGYDTGDTYRMIDYANRRTAASVRCVKNYAAGSIGVRITPSQDWYVPGSEITLHCEGVTTDSYITTAEIVVNNPDKGTSKVIYTTPAGTTEANQPIWERNEVFIVGVLDGEFWSASTYEITLTCYNSLGVKSVSTTTITNHNHVMAIDLSQWKDADYTQSPLYDKENYTRRFVINTSGQSDVPENVTLVYDNGASALTVSPTKVSSVGTAHTYEVAFRIEAYGERNFTISATCPNLSAHVATAHFSTKYVQRTLDPLEFQFQLKGGKMFYWNNEAVVFEWWASTPNACNLTKAEIIYDDYEAGSGLNPGSGVQAAGSVYNNNPNASSVGSAGSPQTYEFTKERAAADRDGVVQTVMTVEDFYGKTASLERTCYIIHNDYEGWDGTKKPDQNFTLGIVISGGAEPVTNGVSAVIGGKTVNFVKDNSYTGTSGRYRDTRWTATLSLTEGNYTNISLTLTFDGGTLTTTAPNLLVANASPLTVSISTNRNYAFVDDKTQNLTINYSVWSPNGNLQSIVIKENGATLTTITPNNTTPQTGTYTYNPSDSKLGTRTFTIEATDVAGMSDVTSTSTTSAKVTVYRVRQMTDTNFTANGTYLIENQSYENYYLYDAGTTVEATETLSPEAFVTFTATGATQTFRFASGHYASGGTSNGGDVSATESSGITYTLTYTSNYWGGGGYYRIYQDGQQDFYWQQDSATNVLTRRNSHYERNWNIYSVTTN